MPVNSEPQLCQVSGPGTVYVVCAGQGIKKLNGSIATVQSFTATAVMQLVEQGKLDLDRDVNGYLDFTIPPAFGPSSRTGGPGRGVPSGPTSKSDAEPARISTQRVNDSARAKQAGADADPKWKRTW